MKGEGGAWERTRNFWGAFTLELGFGAALAAEDALCPDWEEPRNELLNLFGKYRGAGRRRRDGRHRRRQPPERGWHRRVFAPGRWLRPSHDPPAPLSYPPTPGSERPEKRRLSEWSHPVSLPNCSVVLCGPPFRNEADQRRSYTRLTPRSATSRSMEQLHDETLLG